MKQTRSLLLGKTAVFLLTAAVAMTLFRSGTGSPELAQIDDLRMYLIMPDRFDDGDAANNNANGVCDNRNPLAVQGGDLKGIERRLPYLQQLGINAIWITPVQMNVPGAFHGYWIQHFKRVDPRLGTMEDLQRLVRSAHERGMRVYLDVVCNHTGPLIGTVEGGWAWNDSGYTLVWKDSTQLPTPRALQDLSLYHNFGEVREWSDPYQVLGELPGSLDDLRTEDPRVLAIMIEIWSWWMEQSGCDGYRVDTVKHVEMSFWYAWLHAMRRHALEIGEKDFFIFGEVFSGDDEKCASYTRSDGQGRRGFDAVFNFSMAEAMRDVFGRGASVERIAHSVENLSLYAPASRPLQMIFIDNHDKSRFLAVADGNTARMREALTFLYGLQGTPLLYYGTEQNFRGGTGPDWQNRESMFAHGWKGAEPSGDAFDSSAAMFRHILQLNELRARHGILRQGDCTVALTDTMRQLLVLRRSHGSQHAFIIYNASGETQDWSVPEGTRWQLWPESAGLLSAEGRLHVSPGRVAWLLEERQKP